MATIPYRKGYTIVPYEIDGLGLVTYTDGRNTGIVPNQKQCEAYGYTYDEADGVCRAQPFTQGISRAMDNVNNTIKGNGNVLRTGINNTVIIGENNTLKGLSRNNIIVGSQNEILRGVNNATILGDYGLAEREGEVVIGGGGFSGASVGSAQKSTITLTGTTTDATATSLFVNGDPSTIIIARSSTSSYQGFEANVIGVRTGGSAGAGAVNDRAFLRATGIVYLKADDQSVETLGEYGSTSRWTAAVAFSGTNDMLFQVTGAADMNISWSCTLNIYELKV